MPTLHSTITGADNHEPKGVETATLGTVYVANGSGSGTWQSVPAANTSIADTNNVYTSTTVEGALYEAFRSESVASDKLTSQAVNQTILLPIPFSAEVMDITFILGGTITGTTSQFAVTRSDGAAMGTQVLTTAGSAEGTKFVLIPTGTTTLTSPTHSYIKLVYTVTGTGASVPIYVAARLKRI